MLWPSDVIGQRLQHRGFEGRLVRAVFKQLHEHVVSFQVNELLRDQKIAKNGILRRRRP
jgi:hypothetical protein